MANQPNTLLITSDQQHFSTLGVTNPRIQTPALDRLAREGTRFDRAYCPSPVCSQRCSARALRRARRDCQSGTGSVPPG